MDPITKYLQAHKGYARMKEMKRSGIHTREIQRLVKSGRIIKIKPGLYRLANLQPGESHGIVEICLAMPKAVVCLSSALAFHELTTFVPTAISFAIPRAGKPVKLSYPPNDPHFFSDNQYKAGIEYLKIKAGDIRVYGPEKTICDLFRYRNKLGESLALEGLKEYLKRRNRDLDKLMKFAQVCRVKGIISQYVKAIVG
ncbi:MAG TPA: type IV toxin-antitoxin system AbiEi family antitoxin domain-containing protein [Bacteroidota bacterium]|jgi:predicted transcriptional regulator of viral defense system|nr:type IV toxin-antitoxin system AbiEi family antitoxin domain-containing protein [Bacteroidota bacterium]